MYSGIQIARHAKMVTAPTNPINCFIILLASGQVCSDPKTIGRVFGPHHQMGVFRFAHPDTDSMSFLEAMSGNSKVKVEEVMWSVALAGLDLLIG